MMHRFWTYLLLTTLLIATGCTSAVKNTMRLSEKSSQWNPLEKLTKERAENESNDPQIVTMAAIWKDTRMSVAGKSAMRGFGGRIYFYDQDNSPAKADGELVVYGFDGSAEDQSKPTRKFVFKSDTLHEHYSETALGGSYSFWLPWDAIGGYEKTITLIPLFKTSDQRVIKCGQSINVLPGKMPAAKQDGNNGQPYRYLGSSSAVIGQPGEAKPDGVSQASYEENQAKYQEVNQIKTRVTSISLTPNLQNLVKNAQKESPQGKSVAKEGTTVSSKIETAAQSVNAPNATPAVSTPATSQPQQRASRSVYGTPGPLYR